VSGETSITRLIRSGWRRPPADAEQWYYPINGAVHPYSGLRRINATYDPANLFRVNQNIAAGRKFVAGVEPVTR
jgi:hypothetical protein